MKYNKFLEDLELIDQDHKNYSIETPLRKDAFEISDDEKISKNRKKCKGNSRYIRNGYDR